METKMCGERKRSTVKGRKAGKEKENCTYSLFIFSPF